MPSQAHLGPLKLTVLNTHLESTKEHAATRQEQLRTCFSHMKAVDADRVPLLAGDLNLRDSDVSLLRSRKPAGAGQRAVGCLGRN